jgi:hypothetical protein
LFHDLWLTDEDDLYAQLLTGEYRSFDYDSRGAVSPHRVNGDFAHTTRSALFGLENDPSTIESTVGTGTVR